MYSDYTRIHVYTMYVLVGQLSTTCSCIFTWDKTF